MKIRAIHTHEAGPLGSQVFDFKDSWADEIAPNILFTGPNGCGQSSVLRAAAMVWNAFLSGKEILTDIKLGENRLRVKLKNGSGATHGLDELSAGEHQVFIQLYLVSRWLEKGGVALIDEPDLYLHPSLVSGFLARLEKMVADRCGQLIITSHVPEVWNRYEALGSRILLEAGR